MIKINDRLSSKLLLAAARCEKECLSRQETPEDTAACIARIIRRACCYWKTECQVEPFYGYPCCGKIPFRVTFAGYAWLFWYYPQWNLLQLCSALDELLSDVLDADHVEGSESFANLAPTDKETHYGGEKPHHG